MAEYDDIFESMRKSMTDTNEKVREFIRSIGDLNIGMGKLKDVAKGGGMFALGPGLTMVDYLARLAEGQKSFSASTSEFLSDLKKTELQFKAYGKTVELTGKAFLDQSGKMGKGAQGLANLLKYGGDNAIMMDDAIKALSGSTGKFAVQLTKVSSAMRFAVGPLASVVLAFETLRAGVEKSIEMYDDLIKKHKEVATSFQSLEKVTKGIDSGATTRSRLSIEAYSAYQGGTGRRQFLEQMGVGAREGLTIDATKIAISISKSIAKEQGKEFSDTLRDISRKIAIDFVGKTEPERQKALRDWKIRAGIQPQYGPGPMTVLEDMATNFGGVGRNAVNTISGAISSYSRSITGPRYMTSTTPIRDAILESMGIRGLERSVSRIPGAIGAPLERVNEFMRGGFARGNYLINQAEYNLGGRMAQQGLALQSEGARIPGSLPFGFGYSPLLYPLNIFAPSRLATGDDKRRGVFMQQLGLERQSGAMVSQGRANLEEEYRALAKMKGTVDVMKDFQAVSQEIQQLPDTQKKLRTATETKNALYQVMQSPGFGNLPLAQQQDVSTKHAAAVDEYSELKKRTTELQDIMNKNEKFMKFTMEKGMSAYAGIPGMEREYKKKEDELALKEYAAYKEESAKRTYTPEQLKFQGLKEKSLDVLYKEVKEGKEALKQYSEEMEKIDDRIERGQAKKEDFKRKAEIEAAIGTKYATLMDRPDIGYEAKAEELDQARNTLKTQKRIKSTPKEEIDKLEANVARLERETKALYKKGSASELEEKARLMSDFKQTQGANTATAIFQQVIPMMIKNLSAKGAISGEEAGLFQAFAGASDFYNQEKEQAKRLMEMKEDYQKKEISVLTNYLKLRMSTIEAHYNEAISFEKGKLEAGNRRFAPFAQYGAAIEQTRQAGTQAYRGQIAERERRIEEFKTERGIRESGEDLRRGQMEETLGMFGVQMPFGYQFAQMRRRQVRARRDFEEQRRQYYRRKADEDRIARMEVSGQRKTFGDVESQLREAGMSPEEFYQSEQGRQFTLGLLQQGQASYARLGRDVAPRIRGLLGQQRGFEAQKLGVELSMRKFQAQSIEEQIALSQKDIGEREGTIRKEGAESDKGKKAAEEIRSIRADLAGTYKQASDTYLGLGNVDKAKEYSQKYMEEMKKLPEEFKKTAGNELAKANLELKEHTKYLAVIAAKAGLAASPTAGGETPKPGEPGGTSTGATAPGTEAAKVEAAKVEAAKVEAAKVEAGTTPTKLPSSKEAKVGSAPPLTEKKIVTSGFDKTSSFEKAMDYTGGLGGLILNAITLGQYKGPRATFANEIGRVPYRYSPEVEGEGGETGSFTVNGRTINMEDVERQYKTGKINRYGYETLRSKWQEQATETPPTAAGVGEITPGGAKRGIDDYGSLAFGSAAGGSMGVGFNVMKDKSEKLPQFEFGKDELTGNLETDIYSGRLKGIKGDDMSLAERKQGYTNKEAEIFNRMTGNYLKIADMEVGKPVMGMPNIKGDKSRAIWGDIDTGIKSSPDTGGDFGVAKSEDKLGSAGDKMLAAADKMSNIQITVNVKDGKGSASAGGGTAGYGLG